MFDQEGYDDPQLRSDLPQFRYQPECYHNGVFKEVADGQYVTCMCCGRETRYYTNHMYCEESLPIICPWCVSDGTAAARLEGAFVVRYEGGVSGARTQELVERTPGIDAFQGEYWLTCCEDYCAFLGYVGAADLERRGIGDAVYSDPYRQWRFDLDWVRRDLAVDGPVAGYLFECLHCGRPRLWVDLD